MGSGRVGGSFGSEGASFTVREDDLSGVAVRELLAFHLAEAHRNSPPDAVFALDLSGLQGPEVTVWTAWQDRRLAGIGALKRLEHGAAEVKSMRTHPDFLRRGVGALLLDRVIAVARTEGIRRLSLETGAGPGFAAARSLYFKAGFREGGPFAQYRPNGFSRFMHLDPERSPAGNAGAGPSPR